MNYLKKSVLSLAVALCSMLLVSTAQAQENYGIYSNSNDGAFKTSGTAANTTFTAMKDASLTFTVTQSVMSGFGGFINSTSPITVGVFTYTKENGQIVVKESATFTGLQRNSSANTADTLSISADQMVGIYVQRDGNTAFLTEGSGAAYDGGYLPASNVPRGEYQANNASGTGLASFEMDNSWLTFWNDIEIHVEGAFPAPTTTGAPLPGMVATVMLCGAVGGYFNRRKKAIDIE